MLNFTWKLFKAKVTVRMDEIEYFFVLKEFCLRKSDQLKKEIVFKTRIQPVRLPPKKKCHFQTSTAKNPPQKLKKRNPSQL